jgi:tetratricopeptide (TPR) repeat protein
LRQRTVFVGRVAEQAKILHWAETAQSGAGQVVLLSGNAGIGKSRLALECAEAAAKRGALVLIGRCCESREPAPYQPFVEMLEAAFAQARGREAFREALGENAAELAQLMPRLKRLYSDLPPRLELPPLEARRYLFESICDFVTRAAEMRPIILLLDDLQWADESTLALLLHMARRIGRTKVLIVATFRDEEVASNKLLSSAIADLVRVGVDQIRLRGLTLFEVSAMTESLCALKPSVELVGRIEHLTQGNAFFIEELLRHLLEEGKLFDANGDFLSDLQIRENEIPENIRLVVKRRLDRLSVETRDLLGRAAIIGRSFSFGLLQAVAELDSEEVLAGLEEALNLGVLVTSAQGPKAPFSFVHALVRQTVLSTFSPPRRERLHLKVSQALQSLDQTGVDERVAQIADHLLRAGDHADSTEVVHYLGLAAERALEAAAYADALRHLEEALRRCLPDDIGKRADLLFMLATAKRSAVGWDEALVHYHEALSLYKTLRNAKEIGQITVAIAEGLSWGGRQFESAQFAYNALGQLGDDGLAEQARLRGLVAVTATVLGAYESAEGEYAQAWDLAERSGDELARGMVMSYRSFHHFAFLQLDDAIAEGLESARLLRSANAKWALAQLLGFLLTAAYMSGQLSLAEELAEETEKASRRLGHRAAEMLWIRRKGISEFCRVGSLTVLEDWFQRDLELTLASDLPWLATSYAHVGCASFLRGKWDQASQVCEQACASEFPSAFDGPGTGMMLLVKAYLGDRREVLRLLDGSTEKLPKVGSPLTVGATALLLSVIEGLYVIGEQTRVASLYPLALQCLETGAKFMSEVMRFTATGAALAAAAAGLWERAEEHFDRAMGDAIAYSNLLGQAEILRLRGLALLNRELPSEVTRSRDLLGRALGLYEHLAMPRHIELTQSLIDSAHARPVSRIAVTQ